MSGYGKGHSKLNPKAKEFIPNGMQLIAPLLTTSASTSEKYKTSTTELGGTPQGNPPNSWAAVVRGAIFHKEKTQPQVDMPPIAPPRTPSKPTSEKDFWNRNNSPTMSLKEETRDIKINDLITPESHIGIKSNLYPLKGSVSPSYLPNHATTMGMKIEAIDADNLSNKSTLTSYVFDKNFASGSPNFGIRNWKDNPNIYARKIEKQENTDPRRHSEMAALEKITNLPDPFETLNKFYKDHKSDINNGTLRGKDLYDALPGGFKDSFLAKEILNSRRKSDKKLRLKMYMQNSRWYPCDEAGGEYSLQHPEENAGTPCATYLAKTITTLNDIYQHDIDIRLKVANYGDSTQLGRNYAKPMVSRYGSSPTLRRGGKVSFTKYSQKQTPRDNTWYKM